MHSLVGIVTKRQTHYTGTQPLVISLLPAGTLYYGVPGARGSRQDFTNLVLSTAASSAEGGPKLISLLTALLVQRPCFRCIRSGKEDSCFDVQHKKRGRPRFQNDTEVRYGSVIPSRAMCPLSDGRIHLLDESYEAHESLQTPEISIGNSLTKHGGQTSSSNSKPFNTSLSARPSTPKAVAYLTMDLQFIKGSTTFWDVVGLPNMAGQNLGDVVLTIEKEKLAQIRAHFQSEQKVRDMNYIRAALGNEFYNIKELGFSETCRFPLGLYGRLAFVGANGFASLMPVRAGLAMEEPLYCIELLLNIPIKQSRVFHAPSTPILQPSLPNKQSGSGKGFDCHAAFNPTGIHSSERVHPTDPPPRYFRGPADCNEYDSNHRGRGFGVRMDRGPCGRQPHPATHNESAEQIECRLEKETPGFAQRGRITIKDLID